MNRESLALLLSLGHSYEEIGRRFDRHASTVAYWARRHGLSSRPAASQAVRGGLDRARVEELLRRGASIATMARELDVSESAVQYWLRKWGLRTARSHRRAAAVAAKRAGDATVTLECRHHGETAFFIEGRGSYRCLRCRWEAVGRRRRHVKSILVEEAGGCCHLCGYARSAEALHFHHRDPATKSFTIGSRGLTRSLEALRAEAAKCVLLCANCHAEVEAGIVSLAPVGDTVATSP